MSKMYDLKRDAAIIILAKQAMADDMHIETFLHMYRKDREAIIRILGNFGLIITKNIKSPHPIYGFTYTNKHYWNK